jgi:hypothetical protein
MSSFLNGNWEIDILFTDSNVIETISASLYGVIWITISSNRILSLNEPNIGVSPLNNTGFDIYG